MPFILERADGGTSFLNVVDGCDPKREIAQWSLIWGAPVSVREVEAHEIPQDRVFRNALNGTDVDMDKARAIHRNRMREKRKMLFSEIDAEVMKRLRQGLSVADLNKTAQALADAPNDPAIDAITDPAELAEYWPEDVLGENPHKPPPLPPQPPSMPVENYADEFEAALHDAEPPEEDPPLIDDEPEPLHVEALLVPPPPPMDEPLPRVVVRRPSEASLADAMRAVEAAEAYDAPLPEYTPPSEPPSPFEPPAPAQMIVDPSPAPEEGLEKTERQRLREAVNAANDKLTANQWRYHLACNAQNGNHVARQKFERSAKRSGVSIEVYTDHVIKDWKACETAMANIVDIENDALDAITVEPGECLDIINLAIEQIEEEVRHAPTDRS